MNIDENTSRLLEQLSQVPTCEICGVPAADVSRCYLEAIREPERGFLLFETYHELKRVCPGCRAANTAKVALQVGKILDRQRDEQQGRRT